jgi:hypothetical protein
LCCNSLSCYRINKKRVGFEVRTAVVITSSIFQDITPYSPLKNQPTFRRIISPPSAGLKKSRERNQHESRTLLARCFEVGLLLGFFFGLKMEATFSSGTSGDFRRTTWLYIPEYRTLLNKNRDQYLRTVEKQMLTCAQPVFTITELQL